MSVHAAADQWERLSGRIQFRLARAVAKRRQGEFKKLFPNVIGVGAGYRTVGSGRSIRKEFCLRFLVSRKWEDRRNRGGKIPPAVQAYWKHNGRMRRVLVPTDVSELRGEPHRLLDLTDGITSFNGNQPIDYGSACCIVHRRGLRNERYILSCYHVFVPNMIFPVPRNLSLRATDTAGREIGSSFLGGNPSRWVDAALLSIDSGSVDSVGLWQRNAVRQATTSELNEMPFDVPFTLYVRRSTPPTVPGQDRAAPLVVTFVGFHESETPFDYTKDAGRHFYFPSTIEYQAAVRPGDSGSPLLDDTGVLYGMHFYGDDQSGFAMAAPGLFDHGVFPIDIEI